MSKQQRSIYLNSLISQFIESETDVGLIKRVIPVAHPIMEVEHVLRVKKEEKIGVVERYLIEALARFGPMDKKSISTVMGLDQDVVLKVIENFQRYPDSIILTGVEYHVASDALERLTQDHWSYDVEQKTAFFVNSVNGKLLPIVSIRSIPQWQRLRLNMAHGGVQICDSSGNDLDSEVRWIASSNDKGGVDLANVMKTSSKEERTELGVPDGAYAIESGSSKTLRHHWVIAFLVLRSECPLSVVSNFPKNFKLMSVLPANVEEFGGFLRKGNLGIGENLINAKVNHEADVLKSWKDFLDYSIDASSFIVSFKNSKEVPVFESDLKNEQIKIENETQGSGFPSQLWYTILHGYLWSRYSCHVRMIYPKDIETAERMILIQGMRELKKVVSNESEDGVDLELWWKEFQESITECWRPKKDFRQLVSFENMLTCARRSPDAEIINFILDYL